MTSHCTYLDKTVAGVTASGTWLGDFYLSEPDYLWCEFGAAFAQALNLAEVRVQVKQRSSGQIVYTCENTNNVNAPVCGSWCCGHASGVADAKVCAAGWYDVYASMVQQTNPFETATVHAWVNGCDDRQPCWAPSPVALTAKGATTAIAACARVPPAFEYDWYLDGSFLVATAAPSVYLHNLAAGNHTLQAQSRNLAGPSPKSGVLTFTVAGAGGNPPPPQLPAPTGLHVVAMGSTTAIVGWSPVSGAATYGGDVNGQLVGSVSQSGSPQMYLHDLEPSTTYVFDTFAWNPTAGPGAKSAPFSFTTSAASSTGGGGTPPPPSTGSSGTMLLVAGGALVGGVLLVTQARKRKPLPAQPVVAGQSRRRLRRI